MFRKLLLSAAAFACLALSAAARAPRSEVAPAAEVLANKAHAAHRYSVYYRVPGSSDWEFGGGYHSLSAAEDRAADLADCGYQVRIHRHR
jgi:hypothetical protein